jgi:hypothetical protein
VNFTLQLRDFEAFEKVGGRDIALSPGGHQVRPCGVSRF